jgi:CRISPR/Cas system-associated protein Csm6
MSEWNLARVRVFVYLSMSMFVSMSVSMPVLRSLDLRSYFVVCKKKKKNTLIRPVLLYSSKTWVLTKNCSFVREVLSERYAARKSKTVSTGEGTTMNSRESLTTRMP